MRPILRTLSLQWKLAATAVIGIAVLTLVAAPMEVARARNAATGAARSQIIEELREIEEILRVTGRSDLVLSSHGAEPHINVTPVTSDGADAEHPWQTPSGTTFLDSDEPVEVMSRHDGSHWLAIGDRLLADGIEVSVVSAVPMQIITDQSSAAMWRTIRLGTVAALLLGVGAFVVTSVALRTVRQIRLSAQRVAAGTPGAMVVVPAAHDERRSLALTLDVILGDLRRSVEVRDRFLIEASHELRTPVTRLRTEVDLALLRERSEPELIESLQSVARHSAALERLVNQLLDLAHLDQLDRPVSCTFDLQEIAREAVDISTVDCSVDCDLTLTGDPLLLRRAIVNLVENAERHGRQPIAVRAERRGADVIIRVTDNGSAPHGLDRAAQHPIPERRNGGFGLSIVDRVAALHGGSFRLIREAGVTIGELTVDGTGGLPDRT